MAICDRTRDPTVEQKNIKSCTQTNGEFDAQEKMNDTQHFNGIDFRSLAAEKKRQKQKLSLRKLTAGVNSIADNWGEKEKRARAQTGTTQWVTGVGEVRVLNRNQYSLNGGEMSVFESELQNRPENPVCVKGTKPVNLIGAISDQNTGYTNIIGAPGKGENG